MKAAVQSRYGPPEVVRVIDMPDPVPGEHDLLVHVRATTVNRTDCAYRAGQPVVVRAFSGLRRPRRTVLGCEFAGEVVQAGPSVTSFAIGDRVLAYAEGRFGGHAELVTVPEDGCVATVPPETDWSHAACATEGSHYALSFIRSAQVHAGQDVLVHGATGAIGSAAVQLLRDLGATVTATCATAHLALVTDLGADRVIDHSVNDFTRDGAQFDVVMDAVGKSTFGRCRRLLRPGGIYQSSDLGPWLQNPLLALASPLLPGRRVIFPFPQAGPEIFRQLRDRMAAGAFTPMIDRHYDLTDIVEAYRYVETGQKVGNVVVTVA